MSSENALNHTGLPAPKTADRNKAWPASLPKAPETMEGAVGLMEHFSNVLIYTAMKALAL
jgi:hypothetical protein